MASQFSLPNSRTLIIKCFELYEILLEECSTVFPKIIVSFKPGNKFGYYWCVEKTLSFRTFSNFSRHLKAVPLCGEERKLLQIKMTQL